jgi:3-oxoacyl-[acyl-carrier-protein] synthase II
MERRVVITGMGTVNPLGNSVADFWKNAKAGENGIGKITKFDTTDFPSKVAGEVKDLDPTKRGLDKKDVRRNDPFALFALYASIEAMEDAGIKDGDVDPTKIGVILGNGIGGIETLEGDIIKGTQKGFMAVQPLLVPKMISNIGPAVIAIKYNAQGPCYSVVTACSSGTDALGSSFHWIKSGVADVMISGGTEAPITKIALGGFCVLQALSTKHPGYSFWRSSSTRREEARRSTQSSRGTGFPATRIISQLRIRKGEAGSRL